MAVPAPNYTQFPNVLIDNLKYMNDSSIRVALAVARKTFGWHKIKDRISLSQLKDMTGLSIQGILLAVDDLIKKGYLSREAVDETNDRLGYYYQLLVNDVDKQADTDALSTTLTRRLPNKRIASQPGREGLVNDVDTQKKGLNKVKPQTKKKIAATAAPLESSPQIQSPIEPEGDTQNGNASPLRQSPIDDDVPPAPPPPVVKPAKAPRPPDPVFDRLCTMTKSVAAIDGGMIGKTRQTINKDDKHPCTVANLDLFMLWWCSADNWRKKSSAVPELKQMPGLWGKAMAWAEKHAPKPAPIVEQLSPEDAAALEAKLMAEYEANEAERTRRRIAAGYIKA